MEIVELTKFQCEKRARKSPRNLLSECRAKDVAVSQTERKEAADWARIRKTGIHER